MNMVEKYTDVMPVRRSVGERLEEERQELQSRLEVVEAALDALQSNPELERIINLVSRVQDRY